MAANVIWKPALGEEAAANWTGRGGEVRAAIQYPIEHNEHPHCIWAWAGVANTFIASYNVARFADYYQMLVVAARKGREFVVFCSTKMRRRVLQEKSRRAHGEP